MHHTRLPWKKRSKVVGLSTMLFLLPAFRQGLSRNERLACVLQSYVSYLSDYRYAGRPHVSHGVDRLVASANILWHFKRVFGTGYDFAAALCYAMSMKCIALKDRKAYELWHTLWHVTGCLCLMQRLQ